ncbi:hypothetical protein FXO38_07134 [Capsicum annuum]|nr:hypothetical protein FXO37_19798 [Capsicum annuum]KAF3670358.1 hypothetical protein FXO38_07134 [Capsicum annuum]
MSTTTNAIEPNKENTNDVFSASSIQSWLWWWYHHHPHHPPSRRYWWWLRHKYHPKNPTRPPHMAPSPVDDAVSPPHTSPSPVDDDDLLCFSKSEMNDICDKDFVTSVYNNKMSLSKQCCKAVSKVPESLGRLLNLAFQQGYHLS